MLKLTNCCRRFGCSCSRSWHGDERSRHNKRLLRGLRRGAEESEGAVRLPLTSKAQDLLNCCQSDKLSKGLWKKKLVRSTHNGCRNLVAQSVEFYF